MIIVNQKQGCIVNVDKICTIYRRGTDIVCDNVDGDVICILGKYKDEQECAKVMEQVIYGIKSSLVDVFYMPRSME